MSNDCLLLNGNGKPVSYFPLSTINWKTAIRLIFTRNVIIIKNHDSWRVRSPSMEVEVPSIIMLRRFHKFQNYVKFSRSNIFLRDMYKCQYCLDVFERSNLTLDHVVPRSAGGHSHWENIVTSCMTCNVEKGSRDIRPKQMPYKPDYWELANKRSQFPLVVPHHSWKSYLKWDEKLVKVA